MIAGGWLTMLLRRSNKVEQAFVVSKRDKTGLKQPKCSYAYWHQYRHRLRGSKVLNG